MNIVRLIAYTKVDPSPMVDLGFYRNGPVKDGDHLAEFAGRNCYQSFSKPNPATAKNKDYLANILAQSHESVLEHASATFYIEGSRSFLTELNTHRHLSRSVVSQRYVDPEPLGYMIPPVINTLPVPDQEVANELLEMARAGTGQIYDALYELLQANGIERKKAREAARSVLPNMTASPMVVTGNHRAWRDVLKKRWSAHADAEIRIIAGKLLTELRKIAPNTYQDIPEIPFA